MLTLAGVLLMVLGLGSGLFLVLGAAHVVPTPGWPSLLLYPGLTIAGYLLAALATSQPGLPWLTRLAGGLNLALGLLAAAVLVLISLSVLHGPTPPAGLWLALVFGIMVGVAGLTAHRSPSGEA